MRWYVLIVLVLAVIIAHTVGIVTASSGWARGLWSIDTAVWGGMGILTFLKLRKET